MIARHERFFNAFRAGSSFRVNSDFWLSMTKSKKGYLEYTASVNLHERINNRSWLCNSYDGAMLLSYKYNRRKHPKDAPYDDRPKYGCNITGFWNCPY